MLKNYEIKMANAEYTGGGIYVFVGELTNGRYFMMDNFMDIRIMNQFPSLDDEDVWYDEWQEKHLIEDIEDEEERKEFFKMVLTWIKNHGNDGNYSMVDIEYMLKEC